MSSYKGVDLFGSGPHRFAVGRRGQVLVLKGSASGSFNPLEFWTLPVGDRELDVTVTGRLVGATDAAVWALADAIESRSLIGGFESPGVLDDGRGRTWAGMYLLGFEPEGPLERGRLVSLGYNVLFRRIQTSNASP